MKKLSSLINSENLDIKFTGISKLCDFTKSEEIQIKKEFLKIGEIALGKQYQITEFNKEIITSLIKYFTGNGDIDLTKGIYLYGDYGTGKTRIFEIIRKLLAKLFPFNPNGYSIASIEMIVEHYKSEKNLTKYGYNKNDIPLNLCINEFGKKMNEKHFGTDVNAIIESLFMIRYELYQQGKITHVTSNYSPSELNYPPIIKDRISEMFNFIEIKGESFR